LGDLDNLHSFPTRRSSDLTIAVNDGVIMVALNDGHAPTAGYVRKLREVLPAAFPEDLFYFQPADMATQILNFGITAQIDVRTVRSEEHTSELQSPYDLVCR